jgi:parallel beta-helix repeat protein
VSNNKNYIKVKKSIIFSCILHFTIISVHAQEKNYYVSGTGNDSNSGLSISRPFLTIQKASNLSNPGDTVFVMNGTYTNIYSDVVTIKRSGSADKWIVYTAYPGHHPVLQFNGWQGFDVYGAAYIVISGFEIIGNNANMDSITAYAERNNGNNPLTSGNGISVQPNGTQYPHHILIKNNNIHDCGGGGIGTQNADYITIEDNIVYNTSWYSCYDNSGISVGWCSNFDQDTTNYKIIIRGNICYNNKNLIPAIQGGGITDGEGIIVDIQDGTAGGVPAYNGRTLIENNICFYNGGDGITLFRTNNVDVINNTCYLNDQSPSINRGQIAPNQCRNTRIYNNILYALANKKVVFNCCPNINLTMDYNIFWSSSGSPAASLIEVTGAHNQKADPLFVLPSTNAAIADFRLQPGSAAIGSGTPLLAPNIDFEGNPRPSGSGIDIGAYQSLSTSAAKIPNIPSSCIVYPNPTSSGTTLSINSSKSSTYRLNITNISGKSFFQQTVYASAGISDMNIPLQNIEKGIYFLTISDKSFIHILKLVKE